MTARDWGRERGYQGRRGGIYRVGHRVARSWRQLFWAHREAILDWAVVSFSAFQGMQDLLNARGSYRPTIMPYGKLTARMLLTALSYDAAQLIRGDARRAFTPGWTLNSLWAERLR